ncbi:U2 snRNP complex subunit RSE1 [Ascoidea rubescens DSM 1968]|uniref:Pre-mRNA splicing factor rse1 n=1 Tax=Ascoidea rubescens DSM 1968 TaxID=1344418 RepID=A0A1D2VBL6_9ASCO|nr:pre-mRNA splicing factor rse1 [Ascoidea rubescens DSM 1968]ODV59084.1 pre-mRNA splicing factor rse1 [Ascoidea rubescens DSM 1968]
MASVVSDNESDDDNNTSLTSSNSLFLYNLTLQEPSASIKSVHGHFLGKKTEEIVITTSTYLRLYKPDPSTGKLIKLFSQNVFSIIRSVISFRITGNASKDYLAITSDSGNFSILQLDDSGKNLKFVSLFNEPYQKTGIRRLSPGFVIDSDSKGRAIMLSSVEKNNLLYVLNRDHETNKLTISSPLEANRSMILTFTMCGLDVGYDNPIFVSIEVDYGNINNEKRKQLTFYELDLGLNHVIKKSTSLIDESSNFLIHVPGGNDGPSGVLVGCKNFIQYRNFSNKNSKILTLPIPRRIVDYEDNYIITGVVHSIKNSFFFLLQSNLGDLFKVIINYSKSLQVQSMNIKYFDTVPIATSLIILKSGFLFVDSENSDKLFYQFEKLGDDDNEKVFNSHDYFNTSEEIDNLEEISFKTKPLDNLILVDIINSINPVINSQLISSTASNLTELPKILSLCGTNSRSSLKLLENSLTTSELVDSELPQNAVSIWTTKLSSKDEYDKYLILSFIETTLVLTIGENVEEVSNSGFVLDSPTISVQQLGLNSLIQIHTNGIRHLSYLNMDDESQETEPKIVEWFPPAGIKITSAASTNYQVAIGLSNRDLVYFEIDDDEQLIEYSERKEMPGQIISLSLGDIPEGKLRSPFLAVGCNDQTIRILSVDPSSTLELLSVQALSSNASSLIIMSMSGNNTLYVHVGMANGIYVKTILDPITGQLSDTSIRYLGPKGIKLSKLKVDGKECILAMSIKTYIGFMVKNNFKIIPINYKFNLDHGSSFVSEECPSNGIVGIFENNLMIFTIERLSDEFNIESIPLMYTPTRFTNFKKEPNVFYIIESDKNVRGFERKLIGEKENKGKPDKENEYEQFGYDRENDNNVSCLQAININSKELVQHFEFLNNETCLSLSTCYFKEKDMSCLIVGTKSISKSGTSKYYLKTFQEIGNNKIKYLHDTKIDGEAVALIEFDGRLLVGVDNFLRIYEIGKKQLLKKGECQLNCNRIIKILTQGYRIYVGDIRDSIIFVSYKKKNNLFIPFAEDIVKRHTSSFSIIDYDTVIGGDRFGNFWVLRCPRKISKMSDEDLDGNYLMYQDSYLGGTPYRLELVCHFFIEDIPISFDKKSLNISGLNESIIYTGLEGTVGVLIPILVKSELIFFEKLIKLIKKMKEVSVLGRNHLKYRSYYVPMRNVVDGDLCETYLNLTEDEKRKIGIEMDYTVREIEGKIASIRSKFGF